uniref:N-acetyltransferase domain-containing protein n=1 Tax=Caenorhabditis japonica TaxID=281687 RepID=A0A8R1DLT5_CAEJA
MTATTFDIIENPAPSSHLWKNWKHLVDTEGWTSDDNSVTALTPSMSSTRSVFAVTKTPEQKFVGCIIWNEYDKISFMGFYLLAPEYRGKGVGSVIWDLALSRMPSDYVLGLRGVPSMVDKYRKKATPVVGAKLENYKMKVAEFYASMEKTPGHNNYKLVSDLTTEEWEKLVNYDRTVNGRNRREFLALYYKLDITLGVVLFDGSHNVIAHISAVHTSHKEDNIFKIAPLYADSQNIAMSALRVFSREMYEKHPDATVLFHILDIGSGTLLQSFFRSLEINPEVSGVTLFSREYPKKGDLSKVYIAHNNSCHYDY